MSVSSPVHSFQVAACSNDGNQSSNVIVVSSAVSESIGGAFPRRNVEARLSVATLPQLATPVELIGLLTKGVLNKVSPNLVTC